MQDAKLRFVQSATDAEEMWRWLSNVPVATALAVDTETTGLSRYEPGAGVRLVQFGDRDTGWAIDIRRWRGLIEDVVTTWNEAHRPWVGHNLKFDLNFLMMEGIELKGVLHDTMLYSHLVDPGQSHALKNLADHFVAAGSSAGQNTLNRAFDEQKWTWATVPVDFNLYWGYAALDAVITSRLFDEFSRRFPRILASRSYETEIAVMPLLAAMERRGCLIDEAYTIKQRNEMVAYCDEVDDYLRDSWNIKNRQSNQQVAKALLENDVELYAKTGTGQWQLDEEVLLSITHPIAEVVLKARKATKIISTYLNNFLSMRDNDGVLHCDIRQCGAYTGRMSVTGPALQTLPRGRVARDSFIPRPGMHLVSCDLDQVEMRILAEFCRDPNLIEAIMTGDLHTATARLAYNDPNLQKSDPRRQTAKNAGFAKVYGAGVAQFARTAGISIEDATEFLNAYDMRFPGVVHLQRQIDQLARTQKDPDLNPPRGYVESPFGRRQYVKDRDYAMLNYLVQGTAAEVFKMDIIALDAAGFGDNMLIPVHDEMIMEIDDPAVLPEIEKAMTFNEFVVPITASGGVYSRWGEKYA